MDWDAILVAAQEALSLLTGPVATQAEQLVSTFTAALPAIKAGIASAEPFLLNAFKLVTAGDNGVASDQWAIQLSLMQAQVATVDAQVAADEAAEPGN